MDPTERIVRNLITIQRLGNAVNRDVTDLIAGLFDDIVAELARIDPASPKSLKWRKARADKLLKLVREKAKLTYADVHKIVRQDLAKIGVQQAKWAKDQLDTLTAAGVTLGTGPVTVNTMKSVLDADFIRGWLLEEWFKEQAEGVALKVATQIRLGILEGETIGDMVRRVRGRFVRKNVYEGGVMSIMTREATAVVRTGVNHVMNHAHMETYLANADIISGYEYQATLDSRTTLICASLDGQVFDLDDENAPKPPQHWNCRSTILPIVEGFEDLQPTSRASETGPVKGSKTYEKWLAEQPKAKQDDILGPSRARLFRAGKANLRDMVRRDGTTVRVEDLQDA